MTNQRVYEESPEDELLISQIIDGSTAPTFVINKEHIVVHWNKALEKLTGCPAKEMIGTKRQWKPFRDKKRPIMADIILDQYEAGEINKYYGKKWRKSLLIEGGYEAEEFFPNLKKRVFFTAAPIKNAEGKIIGAIETLWDTTEKKEAEDQLELRNKRLADLHERYISLFNNDPNPIFIVDAKTLKILDVNRRAETCYEYSKKELYNSPFLKLGDENDKEILKGLKELSDEQSVLFSKKKHYKKGGVPFYVNISVSYATYKENNVFIASTTDVTEMVEKDIQLIQASKMTTLGLMASGMAHEINQPLNVLQICADFFIKMIKKGESISPEQLKNIAEDISNNVQRAAAIIKHLRDFSRQSDEARSIINLNNPIQEVFNVLGYQIKSHNIKLVVELDPNLPLITADHNRLEQVFINLVTNAIDAMEEKEEKDDEKDFEKLLTVKTFAENNIVTATVADTGIGMSKDTISKIFEPFFTTKMVGKGTGLGVSISHGIVEDYDGKIDIISEIGKGTTFKVAFPAA
ncbi:MAG: PAS domain S-box protein [Deltaproteobacteria bacterium]|nr:PAS domain S-box protein [Deltaproteobacteria bacterium]